MEKISLPTGTLSLKELESVLDGLPVDVTFVDSTDTVRYFNRLGKRIFPRTAAVIGRKVQQCHPQKSLAKVEEILRDFRSGKRDSAEFWISMKGRMVHIRYFALRKDRYLGCLEVSQDVTGIRELNGEKRLL